MKGTVNISITVNTQTEKKQPERQPIDRKNEVLIDNSTSFNGLINILMKRPEAAAAEKTEIAEKIREEEEEKLRSLYGEDYELVCEGQPDLKKEKRRPGAIQLRKYQPRVAMIRIGDNCICEVFSNGYAVYDNGDRKTVLWVPDCGTATYYFTPLKDNEKLYLKQKDDIGEDVFEPLPWYLAVTVAGEDSIERNLVHPKSKGNASDSDDPSDWEGLADWCGAGGTHFDTPEEYVLKKEAEEERRKALTEKQREAYDLYYGEGYTQEEIADICGLSRTTVKVRLRSARNIFGKDPEKFFSVGCTKTGLEKCNR